MLDFVQKSAEVLRCVIPAHAGIQWRVVSNQETLPGFCCKLNPVLFVGTRCYRAFLHVTAGKRNTIILQARSGRI